MNETTLTLQTFQQHIRDRYYQTDSARGTPATFMWFMEEVGELATALHRVADNGGGAEKAAARDNLEEEFADVLAWLSTLANINGVDLTRAVTKKYLTGEGPAGHK